MGFILKKLLILGVDGYLGWSIAKSLVRENYKIIGVDNGLRRELVSKVGSNSLTPIESLNYRTDNLSLINEYMTKDKEKNIIR